MAADSAVARLTAFLMTLLHSRMWAVLRSRRQPLLNCDPFRSAKGSDKGKVGWRGHDCRGFLRPLLERRWTDQEELQRATNQQIVARASPLVCPANGRSILES